MVVTETEMGTSRWTCRLIGGVAEEGHGGGGAHGNEEAEGGHGNEEAEGGGEMVVLPDSMETSTCHRTPQQCSWCVCGGDHGRVYVHVHVIYSTNDWKVATR